ncbi:hypothetical protein DAPPUDRAFT_94230 [Daphnia pulex]|uniref:Uncharacterized protein n=1 Tax=Daphnia pulex TaxID=6669 RepID=E9FQT4_DAPPU|nr:hypothetical protein DAPPUDRAFT_94230 [Daphnia pulex]|eukprot:EFX90046.1 hypothetical protein DAPPUDRAFT_94230 [Daphnia pulex]
MEPAGMSGIRGTQRPRSLCDSKLLSVTPHGLHHHHLVQQQSSRDQQQQQQLVVKRPPPPLPLSPPRAEPSKYRGSWPSMIYYGGGHDQLQQDADAFVRLEQQKRAPSMAGLMNTTVPQRLSPKSHITKTADSTPGDVIGQVGKGSRAKKKPTKRTARAIIHNQMCRDLPAMEEPFKRRACIEREAGSAFRNSNRFLLFY